MELVEVVEISKSKNKWLQMARLQADASANPHARAMVGYRLDARGRGQSAAYLRSRALQSKGRRRRDLTRRARSQVEAGRVQSYNAEKPAAMFERARDPSYDGSLFRQYGMPFYQKTGPLATVPRSR